MEKIPRDTESVLNLIQLKKDRLLVHLPFIQKMVAKLENTELQVKWKTAYDGILSDKKLFSIDQINKLDATVIRLMKQQNERHKKKTVAQEVETYAVPKPAELGRPVLSVSEVQELIEDLLLPEVRTPRLTASPGVSRLSQPSPSKTQPADRLMMFKQEVRKQKVMQRRSSFVNLKNVKKRPDSFPQELIAQSSLRAPYKIPKVTQSPGASPTAAKKQESHLRSFNMFKSLNDIRAKTPPRRWSVACNKSVDKKVSQTPAIGKIKIIKSPSSSKTHEIVKLIKGEPKQETGTPVVISYTLASEKVKEEAKDKKPAQAKQENSEPPDDIEQSMDRLFSEPSTPVPVKKRRSSFSKISKELRRLQENIVKDDTPLPSRRSCAQKRISGGFGGSPVVDDDDKPLAKRIRPSLKIEEKSSPKVEDKSIFGNRRKSRFEEKPPVAVEKPVQEDQPRIGRSTRRSAAAAVIPQKDEAETTRPKRARQSESSAESLTKDFAMKTCSVKLRDAIKSPEKAFKETINSPVTPTRQVAMKSTNQRQQTALNSTGVNGEKPKLTSPENKKEPPKPVTLIYKNICNIAFTKCRNGAIRKCVLQGCRYQTLEKHMFVKHLEVRHNSVRWNGYCNICLKSVMRGKEGHSLINEFIHMEDHLHEEKASSAEVAMVVKSPTPESDADLSDKSPTPESDVSSSVPEVDSNLMKGIDSLLDVLCPANIFKSEGSAKKVKPPVVQNSVIVEELDTTPKPRPSTKFAIPCFPKPAPTAPIIPKAPIAPQTKVISKNIIGRVIPMSQLPGLTGKLIFSKGFKVQLPANTLKINLPPNTIKVPVTAPAASTITRIEPNVFQKSTLKVLQSAQVNIPPKAAAIVQPTRLEATSSQKRPIVADSINTEESMVQNVRDVSKYWTAAPAVRPADPLRFEEVLRPWLGLKSKKNDQSIQALINRNALAATYKCMGKNCTFFTIDSQLFETHLSYHMRFTMLDKIFLGCCYCRFEAEDVRGLIDHINNEHGCDSFQCAFCFYRSFVDFNVINHQNSYHVMRPRTIIRLNNPNKRDFNLELEKVKRNRVETVPPIFCVCRKAQFYIFKAFLNHINEHASSMTTTCAKCRQKTTRSTIHTHLVHCHGYGLYQCVYCRFGTNTREIISHHIANEHPSKMPFFCERNERNLAVDPINGNLTNKTFDPSSIESTCLKHIKQNVKPTCFVEAPDDEIAMRNYGSIGDLGQSLRVQGIIGQQLPKVSLLPNKSGLLDAPKSQQVAIATKTQVQPESVELSATADLPTKVVATPAPIPVLRVPRFKTITPPEPQPVKSKQQALETRRPMVKVRPAAELQQPIVKTKSLSELQTPASDSGTSTFGQIKKSSIFMKKTDTSTVDTLKSEPFPNWAKKPDLNAQRPSLTAGQPKQLLKGSLKSQRSSLPALTSLTAGEILKKGDGTGTLIIKKEVSADREPSPQPLGLQIQNVFSLSEEKQFNDSDWNTSDYED